MTTELQREFTTRYTERKLLGGFLARKELWQSVGNFLKSTSWRGGPRYRNKNADLEDPSSRCIHSGLPLGLPVNPSALQASVSPSVR